MFPRNFPSTPSRIAQQRPERYIIFQKNHVFTFSLASDLHYRGAVQKSYSKLTKNQVTKIELDNYHSSKDCSQSALSTTRVKKLRIIVSPQV